MLLFTEHYCLATQRSNDSVVCQQIFLMNLLLTHYGPTVICQHATRNN